jgi:phosphohistidine phosphatase
VKTLCLLRHAKSSWDNPNLDDFDRPLNQRGEKDAPKIGKRLKEHGFIPDVFCSSPALRAITTAKIVAEVIGFPVSAIKSEQKLYHADEKTLLAFLKNTSGEFDSIMIAGHNPGLTDFANILQGEVIDNIPTTGVLVIEFKILSWREVKEKTGRLIFFEYPKK